jgi:hypothetical protein
MAVDALVALGRTDVVEPWAEWYAARLAERPRVRNAIATEDWREALGDIGRAGDWSVFFERVLDEHRWRDALATWAPRLMPGIMAGATHGILRTAHAVRSLERDETPQRVTELGEGLAYWAARYQELPSAPASAGTLGIADALTHVDLLDPSKRGRFLIFEAVRALDPESFAPAINLVRADVPLDAFVGDVTRTFARHYLTNAPHAAIGFVHTVTAPSALRILAPHLDDATRDALLVAGLRRDLRRIRASARSRIAPAGRGGSGRPHRAGGGIARRTRDQVRGGLSARAPDHR